MLKEFDIQIYKLSNKLHIYEYEVLKPFFEAFEGDMVESGKLSVRVNLDKRENLIEANIVFDGYIDLVCDRSLRDFKHPVDLEKKVLYKYGEEEAELEDNVLVITKSTQVINLGHFIYETIALEVPLKRIHPEELQEDEEHDQYIYIDEDAKDDKDNKEEVDPRWAALKNLKNEN